MPTPKIARGPLLMVGATLAFTLMVACVKSARASLGAADIMVWRAVVAVPLAWWLGRRAGGSLRIGRWRLFALRCALGFSAMFCLYTAARGLAVADVSFIWRSQPVFVALLAPLAWGAVEKPGKRVWIILLVALAGCALLLGPHLAMDGGAVYALVVMLGAALGGAAHVCIRGLTGTERPAALVFWFQVFILVVAWIISAATTGRLFPLVGWALLPALLGAGVFATVGQLLMTHAYQHDRAAVVSAAGYMAPVWGLIVDLVAFDLVPTTVTLLGGVVIVGASMALVFGGGEPVPATARSRSS